jgi:hypothetical protein
MLNEPQIGQQPQYDAFCSQWNFEAQPGQLSASSGMS